MSRSYGGLNSGYWCSATRDRVRIIIHLHKWTIGFLFALHIVFGRSVTTLRDSKLDASVFVINQRTEIHVHEIFDMIAVMHTAPPNSKHNFYGDTVWLTSCTRSSNRFSCQKLLYHLFHFLTTCQYYNTARKQTFGSSVLKGATKPTRITTSELIRFIRLSERFENRC